MKIIFAGTHEIALPPLKALINSPYEIVAVYTQPDRPVGRGQKIMVGDVKQLAQQHHLPVFQPVSLRNKEEQEKLQSLHADLMIVIGYGLLLPVEILQAPRFGCWNAHISLLPRWRGAAPVQRAILAGDQETGVTIMQMNEGLDTGDILKQKTCPINPNDTSAILHQRLANLSAELLLEILPDLLHNKLNPVPQDNAKATYAAKINKAEAKVNWQNSALVIDRQVRAFNPWPIAFTEYQGQNIRLWQTHAEPYAHQQAPGAILQIEKSGLLVATRDGALRILELQLPGGKRLLFSEFLNSKRDFFKENDLFSF